ncbi:Panacea domain-containing protein [Lactococcus lactis]|uniref:Panacea domain-containing protein n=1 Tax=Lactococcus lactis TaxID=1358 RepID=UPI0017809783|nr:type II toxin-antitoxin system antitoxin SocA domain-containing protein [Lactococcus lactis]MBD5855127.1 DUF4065 domain-containing protein [Lactococcus lactis]
MDEYELQSPMALANFVINFANAEGSPVSNLQLQKILYFIQTAFLVEHGNPIINGNFSRWQYGPVLQEVYSSYRDNGAAEINDLAINVTKDSHDQYMMVSVEPTNEESLGSSEAFTRLQEITRRLIARDPWELVQVSHQQSIWEKYEKQIAVHMAPDYENSEIENEGTEVSYLWE